MELLGLKKYRHNLIKIYIRYRCFICNTSLPKLSITLGHHHSWLSTDILNPHSTISVQYYRKCLNLLSQKLCVPYQTLLILSHNHKKDFAKVLSDIYKHIRTRRDLLGYIKICLTLNNSSFTRLAKVRHHNINYYQMALINTTSKSNYCKLLTSLAKGLHMPTTKLTRFSNLPKVNTLIIGREQIIHFLICYAEANGTTLKGLSKRVHKNLRKNILTGSNARFFDCLRLIKHLLYMPSSIFKLILNQDNKIYESIRLIALHHVHDRYSLEQCLRCLTDCNNTTLTKIERHYHYPENHIISYAAGGYYSSVMSLLLRISPALAVDHQYIQQLMKRSHIPKVYGVNGNYDNLLAYIKCYCLRANITRSDLSKKIFDGNPHKLTALMKKDMLYLNHHIVKQLSLTGMPKSDLINAMRGSLRPINTIVENLRKHVHNRRSLLLYIHAFVVQHHTNFTKIAHKLNRPANYINHTITYNYYETIANLFKHLSQLFKEPVHPLIQALRQSHIRHSIRRIPNTLRKRTKLNHENRVNIKNKLYQLIRKHHIYPTHLNYTLHPHFKFNTKLVNDLLNGSRETLITESAMILNYLHESPKQLEPTLNQNKMGKYYPLLVQKCHDIKH